MYYRFPVLMVMLFAVLVGVFYFKGKVNSHGLNSGEPVVISDLLKPSVNEALQTISGEQLRAHLEFLADDLLEGRDTGSRGARVAALYIASQFERMGLQPVGENQSYFQTVPMVQKQVSAKSQLKIEVDGEMYPLTYGKDFIVVSAPRQSSKTLSGELVFTGFGIRAPEYNYDDFKNVEVSGKFTVFLSGEPLSHDEKFFAGDKPTKYANGYLKRGTAQKMNALGAITILQRETLEHVSWADLHNYYDGAQMALDKKQPPAGASDFAAIIVHPEAADLIFAGSPKTFAAIQEEVAKGEVTAFEMKKKIQLQIFVDEQKIEDRNVVGYIEGADPQLKSEVVVFSAHYDHVGIGTPVAGDSIYNGAADNASGVAGLLELAEAFSLLSEPPKRSLLFLALTAEEKGLLGSEFYVDNPIFPIAQTVANFNFDIIGLGDSTGLVVYGQERSSLGEVVAKAAQQLNLKIMPDDLPEENIFLRSDHYSFAKKGVPAVFPSFGLDREGFQKFVKYYHQPSDDITLPFNYNYMKKHVQVVFLSGMWVANASHPPSWTKGDEFEKLQETGD
jgi:Zn-dependent M28 family amino/carboxypeptidase